MMSDIEMTLYNIYYHDGCGNKDLVATTNNLDKWLKANNQERVADGNEPEKLEDFEIQETDSFIFEEKMNKPKMEIVSDDLVWIDFKGKEIRLEQDNLYNEGKLMITVHNKDKDYHAKLLVEEMNNDN